MERLTPSSRASTFAVNPSRRLTRSRILPENPPGALEPRAAASGIPYQGSTARERLCLETLSDPKVFSSAHPTKNLDTIEGPFKVESTGRRPQPQPRSAIFRTLLENPPLVSCLSIRAGIYSCVPEGREGGA